MGGLHFGIIVHELAGKLEGMAHWSEGEPVRASETPDEGSDGFVVRDGVEYRSVESGAALRPTVPVDWDACLFSWVDWVDSVATVPIRRRRASTCWRVRNKSGRRATNESSRSAAGAPGDGVRPFGRNIGTGAVRKDQHRMALALAFEFSKHFEDLAEQRMVWPGDPNVCGKVPEGGSVSWVLLTG